MEDNNQQRDDEEHDVDHEKSNKEYLRSLELVINDLLHSVLLVELNILIWLNHQLG